MVKVDLYKALESLGPLDEDESTAEDMRPPPPEPAPVPRLNPSKRRSGGNSTRREELEARLQYVETLLAQGCPRPTIMNLVRKQYGESISTLTVDRYVRKVREEWRSRRLEEREYDYELTIERLRRASLKLEGKGEWGAWMMCERLLAEVRGVRAPQKHLVSIGIGAAAKLDYSGLSDDELVNLRTLMLKAQQGKALPPVSIGDARVVDKPKG